MSEIKERFIKVLEALPYDINQEILMRETKDILQEITHRYIETYGVDDLSDNDKECIESLIGMKIQIRKKVDFYG